MQMEFCKQKRRFFFVDIRSTAVFAAGLLCLYVNNKHLSFINAFPSSVIPHFYRVLSPFFFVSGPIIFLLTSSIFWVIRAVCMSACMYVLTTHQKEFECRVSGHGSENEEQRWH